MYEQFAIMNSVFNNKFLEKICIQILLVKKYFIILIFY